MLIATHQVPDNLQDLLSTLAIKPSHKAKILAHCRRELMHQVWCLMLDDDFLVAYQHGLVLKCADGLIRRVYPRIFTYSADYPEK